MPRIDGSQNVQPQPSVQQNVSGQLGTRQVRAGQADLPRLDRIKGTEPPKGNFLTRSFESVATKMDRTSRSLDRHTKQLLDTLDRGPGKRLDGKALLNEIATLRNHHALMSRLSGQPIDPTATLQIALAGRLGGMDNEKVMNVYRTFLSEDTTSLRSALEAETLRNPGNVAAKHCLEDLGVIEATLLMEISGRVARGHGDRDVPPLQERLQARSRSDALAPLINARNELHNDAASHTLRLGDKGLEILVESGARSANLHDRTLASQADARLERKGFDLATRQVGDAMRAADLTMNFSLGDFLGIGKPTATIDTCDSMRNMFQWGVRPSDDNVGALKRDITERQFFESLEKSSLDPDNRPTYGALNVGRSSKGSADAYGASFFVLKPEVKQRCTFTIDDTFNVPRCKATPEGLAKFDNALPTLLPRLSEKAREFLAADDNTGKIRSKLEALESFSTLGLEGTIHEALGNTVRVSHDDLNSIALLAQQVLIDRDATHAQVAGYDNVENLLSHVGDERLNLMMMSVESPSKGNIRIGNYIEAQIHGRVAFDTDIQAMRVSENDVTELARGSGGALTADAVKKKLADFCGRNGIELTYYDDAALSIDEESSSHSAYEKEIFSPAHADPHVVSAQRNETSTALNALLDGSNATPNGFTGILASTARDMQFDASALNEINLGKLKENIARAVFNESGNGLHRVDESKVQSFARNAIRDFIGTKGSLLATVENFDMPEQHKSVFKAFALGSSTLRNPAMLTALHQSTGTGITLLQTLANMSSIARPEQLEKALGELRGFVEGCRSALDSLSRPDKPWGRDDLMLYTDRALSLSASLFAQGSDRAASLYSQLTSPEVIKLGDALQFDGKSLDSTENTRRNMADALHILTIMVGREAGHSAPEVERALHHEFSIRHHTDMPMPLRQALSSLNLL